MSQGNYKIFISDENKNYSICIRDKDSNLIARFNTLEEAQSYAKEIGLLSGFIIKK